MERANNMDLAEEIKLIVSSVANNNPAPKKCLIKDIYPDGYVDVSVSYGDEFETIIYRPCLGGPVIGDEALIVFVDGKILDGYVICNGGNPGLPILKYHEDTGDLCAEYTGSELIKPVFEYRFDTGDLCVEYLLKEGISNG